MEKAIISKFECNSCGNIAETKQVLITNQKKSKYSFEPPKNCGCGKKDGFVLLSFLPGTATIKPDIGQ